MVMKNDILNLTSSKILFSTVLATAMFLAVPGMSRAEVAGVQAVQQAGIVKGHVVDAKGEPLIGVSVVIAGQKGGNYHGYQR